ncbi:MAG: phosphoenolpyruvate synthase [Chlorobi bacterium]|nr:phosphoenolpyruvate synthase [Chlorobiota bacterium]
MGEFPYTYTLDKYDFGDVSFELLMQKRIHRVLLVVNRYDAFILEEDGRIDEQIFNEYVSLSLRYPPVFIQAGSPEKALNILENEQIDLVISALKIGDRDAFALAREMKSRYPEIPIVVLTYFSREVSRKIETEDLSAIDYVFSWLGNADLLLAIIKLIEDKMNAEYDIRNIGVQAIILVEDSIRYTSSYLPSLYRIIFQQSKEFQQEGLNEHQKMIRMRGRPKVLLATNFEDAVGLFEKYKFNTLGIISDVSFKKEGKKDPEAGLHLLHHVRKADPHMPFLLQSSDASYAETAYKNDAGFIHKYSKSLSHELKQFIIDYLAFGPFVFIDPDTGKEIDRATDLQEFQQKLMQIPDKTLEYHTLRNHFSRWLNARALFPIAQMFKYLKNEDFPSLEDLRRFVFVSVSSYRLGRSRGVIAQFDAETYDEYAVFSRIGEGSIGGKARGLAFVNIMIKENRLFNKFDNVLISIPRTVVISTEVFDEFMDRNKLYEVGLADLPDEEILKSFVKAELPASLDKDLEAFLKVVRNPVAIRSSSKLEDSHYQPFAGIYSTYMIPGHSDYRWMLGALKDAIRQVYASVYFKNSKAYMTATSNVIDEEKMGIILQEVCGNAHGSLFYPTFSGVARSINYYPIEPEKPGDGIVRVAFGLGKIIVDGGTSLRFSPRYPQKILQLSSTDTVLKETQRLFYALDLHPESFVPSVDDSVNLKKLRIGDAPEDKALQYVASTYDFQNHMIRDGIQESGKRIITFANILQHKQFPLPDIVSELLETGQREMGNPIEIEFAANLETPKGLPQIFNFLQIRPIVVGEEGLDVNINEWKQEDVLLYSDAALGNGLITGIRDMVYIKPESFNAARSAEIAAVVDKLNRQFGNGNENYILMGPGRWGSSDPWLGIPVKWPQISNARLIIEAGKKDYRIDPSQGTHFFQNLTSFRVAYFTINPELNDGILDLQWLNAMPAVYEDDFLRHIRFPEPVTIRVDGRKNRGVVLKPGVND